MGPIRPQLVTFGLLALLGASAFANYKLAYLPVDTSPTPVTGEAAPLAVAPDHEAVSDKPQLADLRETTARPLFHASRRPRTEQLPPEPAATPAPEPTPESVKPSQISLVGLIKAPGIRPRALLRSEGRSLGTWVGVGEAIDGWTLADIGDGIVTLQSGSGMEKIRLHAARQP